MPMWGELGLDPATLVALPVVLIPQPAGVASFTLRVPVEPALAGATIYSQALIGETSLQARFSNARADQILP
ncbi:MAG: hypothetical protein AAF628_36105 [Planctomycetota bacterium]